MLLENFPNITAQGNGDCGPAALKSVLNYLGEDIDKETLVRLVQSEKSGLTWTIGIVRAAAYLGFGTEYYFEGEFDAKSPFIQKEGGNLKKAEQKNRRLFREAEKLGAKIEQRTFTLDELLSRINFDCVPLACIDYNYILESFLGLKDPFYPEFFGHFVPIIGYNDRKVYFHDVRYTYNPKNIDRFCFDLARKAADGAIVFISRKK